MKINCDWHIHTTHSCDCAKSGRGVGMATLAEKAAENDIEFFGVTDHFFTGYNLDEIFRSKEEFDSIPFNENFHFGVEMGCVSEWELDEINSGRLPAGMFGIAKGGEPWSAPALAITDEDISEYGIEYVIAAVHRPLYIELTSENVIKDYARQNMFLACHPKVDIVGHPWWWMGHWRDDDGFYSTDPWLDDFGKIPLSVHDEFAAAVVENKKAVEINTEGCVFNHSYRESFTPQYMDYIAYLHERGVKFSIGSDCHSPEYNIKPVFEKLAGLLSEIGISEKDLWRLPPRKEQ